VRQPVVAGSFYPADPLRLRDLVVDSLGVEAPPRAPSSVGVVVPHAGYVYSGRVAGAGLRAAAAYGKPDVILVLGASHSGAGGAFALPVEGAWRTPLGDVPLDVPKIERLVALGMARDAGAFRREHSMEVVLPFLQVLFPEPPPVLPVCVQLAQWATLSAGARSLVAAVGGKRAWIVASSDFTHYEPDDVARRLDRSALDLILAGDAEGFYRQTIDRGLTICGAGAICALLLVARDLGLTMGSLVDYATSGDVTGDRSAVVGYAAVSFTKENS
jgi:AmmeMemoRadiSam system protein B